MGISVTEDTTTIEVSGDTTVTVTENVTSVSVSDSTATLTVQPSETTVAVTGNTTSINVEAETQEILVNESSYLGNFGGQTLNGSLYVTGHLTHGGVLTDTSSIKHTDFTSAGFMRTDGSGNYTVDSNTYLTSFTEQNDLSASVTWADVPDDNITETSVTQHQSALSIEESQISDLQSYLTSYTETDPVFSAHASSGITATQILNWDTAYGWDNHADAGYLTSETSHDDVLVDGDFATAGFMKTDGAGNYSIDNSTYLTSFTETNDLQTSVTWANVPDQNITESSVTQHQAALSITESQISDFGTYLTSFDITTQTDPKYLRADADDTTTGTITADGGFSTLQGHIATNTGNITSAYGSIVIGGTVTARNLDIAGAGSFTTNIATGTGGSGDTKTVNIATGYSTGGTTTVNIAPTSSTTTKQINLNGDVSIDGTVTGGLSGVVLEHDKSNDLEPVLELQNTTASGSGYRGAFISMTGYNTSGTEYTRGVIGMGNSTAQYSFPYIAANIYSVSCGIKLSGSSSTSYNALTPCNSIGASLNNGMQCGHPFYKWNTVYATNGNIATSDQTHKRDVEELSEAETRVAVACKGLLRKYRWKDAYEEKGEEARIHFGIMAQDLRDAFSNEGLDASRYAMFCSDTWWEDETGERHEEQELAPEGAVETTQLGVRYDELLAFIIAAI